MADEREAFAKLLRHRSPSIWNWDEEKSFIHDAYRDIVPSEKAGVGDNIANAIVGFGGVGTQGQLVPAWENEKVPSLAEYLKTADAFHVVGTPIAAAINFAEGMYREPKNSARRYMHDIETDWNNRLEHERDMLTYLKDIEDLRTQQSTNIEFVRYISEMMQHIDNAINSLHRDNQYD
jgi:signal transduction histidine kinase